MHYRGVIYSSKSCIGMQLTEKRRKGNHNHRAHARTSTKLCNQRSGARNECVFIHLPICFFDDGPLVVFGQLFARFLDPATDRVGCGAILFAELVGRDQGLEALSHNLILLLLAEDPLVLFAHEGGQPRGRIR